LLGGHCVCSTLLCWRAVRRGCARDRGGSQRREDSAR